MTFKQQIGANLKRLREGAGLSQEQLMWRSGVHRSQIPKYERGHTEPQAEVLARFSRALGVSTEEFFSGVGWQQEPPRLVMGTGQRPSRGTADCGRSCQSWRLL